MAQHDPVSQRTVGPYQPITVWAGGERCFECNTVFLIQDDVVQDRDARVAHARCVSSAIMRTPPSDLDVLEAVEAKRLPTKEEYNAIVKRAQELGPPFLTDELRNNSIFELKLLKMRAMGFVKGRRRDIQLTPEGDIELRKLRAEVRPLKDMDPSEMTQDQLISEVLRLRAQPDFREMLRKDIAQMMKGMRLRPEMYGRPTELEAIWHTLIGFETLLLTPQPTVEERHDAIYKASQPIQWRNKWPYVTGLATNGINEKETMLVLCEMRENYFRLLGREVEHD